MKMDDYEVWEIIAQIRSAIDCLERYIQDEDGEHSTNTVYYGLEGIRLKTDMIEAIMAQPLEDRLTAADIQRLASKLNMRQDQIYTMIYQEDKDHDRKTA